MKRLVQSKVLRAVAIPHPDSVGARVCAIVALNVTHANIDEVAKELASQIEIKWVASTTGRFDILVLVEFNAAEELSRYIRNKFI